MKRDVQAQGYYHSTVNGSLGRRPGLTTIPPPPAPEVVEKARRRTFSAEYNRFGKLTTGLRMLREAAACTASGAIGALLRREGLYSSHLTDWRRQHERGSKVHAAVDTLGMLLALLVTSADEQDRSQVEALAKRVQEVTGASVEVVFVDQGYTGEKAEEAAAK